MSQQQAHRIADVIRKNSRYGKKPNVKEPVPVTDFTVKLRESLLAKGYLTSFSYHHTLPKYRVDRDHISHLDPITQVSRSFAEIYEFAGAVIISLFHPKQALPIHIHYGIGTHELSLIEAGSILQSDYASHYKTLEEVLADHPADYYEADEEAQRALIKARRPGEDLPEFPVPKYNPAHARYLDLRGKTAETLYIDESPFSDNVDIFNGNLKPTLETSNHDSDVTEVVKDEEELAEDIELGRIADEREGQARIRVDINDL